MNVIIRIGMVATIIRCRMEVEKCSTTLVVSGMLMTLFTIINGLWIEILEHRQTIRLEIILRFCFITTVEVYLSLMQQVIIMMNHPTLLKQEQ